MSVGVGSEVEELGMNEMEMLFFACCCPNLF